jgi:ethanolamine permease
LPQGWSGVLATLPFAVWLFLAIEQLPLAAEESADPKTDMPRALILGMTTLMVSALLVVFLNSGVGSVEPDKMQGAASLAKSSEPLLDGFRVIFGGATSKTLAFLAVIGLIASFHTIIYAYGRQIYSLSRAGYYLDFMSLTSGRHKVPHMALFSGTVLGFATMLVVWFVAGEQDRGAVIGGTLLNMAVFGAMISYAMQGLSFILLRRNLPNIERPYRSPLGSFGAALTMAIAIVTLYYQLQDPVYRNGVYAVAVFYGIGLAYFALVGRHRLILSPEEEFAMSHDQKQGT